MIINVF
jgi:FtsZ-binding cell division protein ZapB